MIVFDASETRTGALSANIVKNGGYDVIDWLEEVTGADVLVSPRATPRLSPKTLMLHINSGAILIQVKHGFDLASSLGERLSESLARMISIAPKQCQRELLFIGVLTCDKEGFAVIDGRDVEIAGRNILYRSIISAMRVWSDRGGTLAPSLSRAVLMHDYLRLREEKLIEYHVKPEVEVWPSLTPMYRAPAPNDPLQEIRLVKDWRVMLAAVDGIGKVKINALVAALSEAGIPPTGGNALVWASDINHPVKVKGWGEKSKKLIQNMLGLDDDHMLAIMERVMVYDLEETIKALKLAASGDTDDMKDVLKPMFPKEGEEGENANSH